MLSIHRIAAAATIAAALCVPATAASDDWYKTGEPAATTQDRITPDARDAGRPAVSEQVDRVTPDARDAARPRIHVPAPTRTRIVEVPQAGFEWGDAAIGGAATLALVLLLAGLGMAMRPRRTATSSS
jgi:predicted NBD/HSP70 family sugar kinase